MHTIKVLFVLFLLSGTTVQALNLPAGFVQREGTVFREKDQAIMILIPAGTYFVGSEEPLHPPEEKPLLSVKVPDYLLDRDEISREKYEACVMGGGCTMASFSTQEPKSLPANFVTWDQARSYCQWVSTDLPTEVQWEVGSRGRSSTVYPSGTKPRSAIPDSLELAEGEANEGFGVSNASGNVSEWMLDDAETDVSVKPRNLNPDQSAQRRIDMDAVRRAEGKDKVVKGASYKSAFPSFQRASSRKSWEKSATADWLGFRCALTIP